MKKTLVLLLCVTLLVLSGCSKQAEQPEKDNKQVQTQEVSLYMWGGNPKVNAYIDDYVARVLKEEKNIQLKRIPSVPTEYLKKLMNEKKGEMDQGTIDLVWINGNNFKSAKENGLLWGPFAEELYKDVSYYNSEASDLQYDSGVAIDGYEAIWGRAQLVFTYDTLAMPVPPKNYQELLDYAKENPGVITYPLVTDDFAGSAFVRTSLYSFLEDTSVLEQTLTKEEFTKLCTPMVDYFNELKPYLWQEGNVYPKNQAQQDELFKNGEVVMTMGFEIGKTAGLIQEKVYPDTTDTFVFDTGTIGNSHYLAIPYNAPNKEAAVEVIRFLQGADAQIEKMKSQVWGDMPAFDVKGLTEEQQKQVSTLGNVKGQISQEILSQRRLPELKDQYIEWIEDLWREKIL